MSPVLRNVKNTSRSMVKSMRKKGRIEQFLRVLSSIRGGEVRNHRELRSELGKQSQTAASERRHVSDDGAANNSQIPNSDDP